MTPFYSGHCETDVNNVEDIYNYGLIGESLASGDIIPVNREWSGAAFTKYLHGLFFTLELFHLHPMLFWKWPSPAF